MKVAVVGGGPAGMIAALFAARNGNDVTILEKNEKLGKKLYITGKGRCNVTNAGGPEELLRNVTTNPRFLYSALHAFDSGDLIDLSDLGEKVMIKDLDMARLKAGDLLGFDGHIAIVLGLRDYMRKNSFSDVVLGVSGGLDSALVAALAVRALGAEHVHGVALPSCYNASISLEDANKLGANLGIDMRTISIEKPRQVFRHRVIKSGTGM